MQTLSADLVVVGAGLAGMTAALAAAEGGAEVLLIEKQPDVGGSSVLSGGSFAFAGTDLQLALGIEDSPELLARDLLAVGNHRNDPEMVAVYAANQLDAYDWLRRRDVEFGPIEISSGQSVPRLHATRPPMVIANLRARVEAARTVRLMPGVAARSLEADGDRVTGVAAEGAEGPMRLTAGTGVVLTSGGFSRNDDMIESFVPGQRGALRGGGPGNVGDGLRMAWRLGAGFRDIGYIKGTFGNHPDATPEQHTGLMAVYKGAIAVNSKGRRFADESISYKTLGDLVLAQPGGIGYQIFDQPIMDQTQPLVRIFDFQSRLDEGLLLSGPGLAALAERIGIPAEALETTVAAYNDHVDAGEDRDFGRTGLASGFGALRRIEMAPFYAYPSTSMVLATYCGLTVDPSMRVRRVDGTTIGGLFAAGEIVGGFHGEAYMTGTSLGKCAICALAAARAATGADRTAA